MSRQPSGPDSAEEERMVGSWEYRSCWHGLVVGDFAIDRDRARQREPLRISERHSRDGLSLSGDLERTEGDAGAADGEPAWYVAEFQQGYSCRVRLSAADADQLVSQFREAGGLWEAEVVSRRRGSSASQSRSLAVSLASVLASGMASSVLFGPQLGCGVLALLMVHELGHLWAMRCHGLPAGPVVFVPFVGAAVELQRTPALAVHEGLIVLAGPLFGSCAALACLDLAGALAGAGEAGGEAAALLARLANIGLALEIFNLLPLGVLDGGRLLPLLSPWALPAGLLGSLGLLALDPGFAPPYALCAALAVALARGRGAARRSDRPPGYYDRLLPRQRSLLSAGYLTLLAVLSYNLLASARPAGGAGPRVPAT